MTGLGSLRRGWRIAATCARHSAAVALTRRLPRVAAACGVQPLDGPERLRRAFEDVGGTFVKFGQMLALQPDILPPEYCSALFELLDRVAPFPWLEVERVVREELGAPPDVLFDAFERTPIATASVGQVHVAWVTGQKVAVKIQRPTVEAEFASDVRLMAGTIRAIRLLRLHALEFLIEPMEEFIGWTEEELDYRHEARYGELLRRNARGNPAMYVPRIHGRFTTRRVLVTEYLDGVTLLDYLRARECGDQVLLARLAARGFDRTRFAANVIENFLGDCFRFGLYHADLHPANLMILDDSVVGYIDFGITGAMSAYSRRHLMAMTLALARGDTTNLHAEFLRLSSLAPDADVRGLHDALSGLVAVWYQEDRTGRRLQVSFTRVCRDMLAVSRQTGVLPERDIIKYIRSAIAIDGLCGRFRPEFHVGQRLADVCAREIGKRASADALGLHNLVATSAAGARLMVEGPGRSFRLLDRLATGDLPVEALPVSDARAAEARGGAVRLAALAALLALLVAFGESGATLGWNLFTAELSLMALTLGFLVPALRRLHLSPTPRAGP